MVDKIKVYCNCVYPECDTEENIGICTNCNYPIEKIYPNSPGARLSEKVNEIIDSINEMKKSIEEIKDSIEELKFFSNSSIDLLNNCNDHSDGLWKKTTEFRF